MPHGCIRDVDSSLGIGGHVSRHDLIIIESKTEMQVRIQVYSGTLRVKLRREGKKREAKAELRYRGSDIFVNTMIYACVHITEGKKHELQ